jgi:hypothetical protein
VRRPRRAGSLHFLHHLRFIGVRFPEPFFLGRAITAVVPLSSIVCFITFFFSVI